MDPNERFAEIILEWNDDDTPNWTSLPVIIPAAWGSEELEQHLRSVAAQQRWETWQELFGQADLSPVRILDDPAAPYPTVRFDGWESLSEEESC